MTEPTVGDLTRRAATRAERQILTVRGPISPSELGVTLVHEHLLLDGGCFFDPGTDADSEVFANLPLTPEILARVRAASCSNRDNLLLDDVELALAEATEFMALGGEAIVDVTSSVGLGRDPEGLRGLSERTGLHVVMGSGFYCEYSHPDFVDAAKTDELAERIIGEIVEGVEGVFAGVIGEIGVNGQEKGTLRQVGEMTASEERSLRAACRASLETGAAIIVHQPNRTSAVPAILRVLDSEQVLPERVVLGHMSSVPDFSAHLAVLERGYWIAYDNFGMTLANRWYRPIEDAQRIDWLLEVSRRGFLNRLLISQDVWCKVQLRRFGGGGYTHILRTIVPALRGRGITEDEIAQLLIHNPAELLAF